MKLLQFGAQRTNWWNFFSKPFSGSKFTEIRCKVINTTELDILYKIATCPHQTSVMNYISKICHRCGVKEEINTLSSSEQDVLGLEQELPESIDIMNAYVYTD